MVSTVSAVYVLGALVLFAPLVCAKHMKVSAHHLSTSQRGVYDEAFELVPHFAASIGSFTEGSSGNSGRVTIDGVKYMTGPISPVTRTGLVPVERKSHLAKFFCFVRFGKDAEEKDAPLKIGGFIYFADKDSVVKGNPMTETRVMKVNEKGTLRFASEAEDVDGDADSSLMKMLSLPGVKASRWWPTTVVKLKDFGYSHYTWIAPGEVLNGHAAKGGFMVADQYGGSYKYYEMLAECIELEETIYDKWMAIGSDGSTSAQMYTDKPQTTHVLVQDTPVSVGPKTLLLVIDMQNDFVEKSFQQPCKYKREYLTEGLRDLIGQFRAQKGSVVASMDYHPQDHCSFKGFGDDSCNNTAWLSDSDKSGNRYKNPFPQHTLYDVVGEQSVPRFGALLNANVAGALHDAAVDAQNDQDPGRVQLIFKGFNEKIESFSAMPHLHSGKPEVGTGGYALPVTGVPEACFGEDPPDTCFPTAQQLKDPDTSMRRANEVVKEIVQAKGITDIVVAGLVHDYCVKETAIFTKKWVDAYSKELPSHPRVSVLMEYARPAFEGNPFTLINLGTMDHNLEVAADLARENVPYVTLQQLGIERK